MKAEKLAKRFHEIYEDLAPKYMYKTRPETRKAWEEVPKNNKDLMIATAERILDELQLESLGRIERMLKWLIWKNTTGEDVKRLESVIGMNPNDSKFEKEKNDCHVKLLNSEPDISDIIEEKK